MPPPAATPTKPFTSRRRFRAGRSRGWAVASVVLSVLGCAWTVASLWYPWAVDGRYRGVAPDLTGWEWMSYGDYLLLVAVGIVLVLVATLVLKPPSRRLTWVAGLSALGLIGLAATGAAMVWWLTGTEFFVMDPSDLPEHGRGGGARRAVTGLAVATLGVMAAMRSRRWDAVDDARPEAALAQPRPERHSATAPRSDSSAAG